MVKLLTPMIKAFLAIHKKIDYIILIISKKKTTACTKITHYRMVTKTECKLVSKELVLLHTESLQ